MQYFSICHCVYRKLLSCLFCLAVSQRGVVTEICSTSQEAVRDIPNGAKLLVGGTVGRACRCYCAFELHGVLILAIPLTRIVLFS